VLRQEDAKRREIKMITSDIMMLPHCIAVLDKPEFNFMRENSNTPVAAN
jgi:hypothetical protein